MIVSTKKKVKWPNEEPKGFCTLIGHSNANNRVKEKVGHLPTHHGSQKLFPCEIKGQNFTTIPSESLLKLIHRASFRLLYPLKTFNIKRKMIVGLKETK